MDGQQRITSLTAIITGKPIYVRNRKKPIEILFNLGHPEGPPIEVLEVEEDDVGDKDDNDIQNGNQRDIQEELNKRIFIVSGGALKSNSSWVSVSDIFKMSDREILRSIGIPFDDDRWDKYSERLKRLRQIENYMYVMEVLPPNMSYQEVTQIFVRVNSKGVKLRGHDLAVAQISAKWKGFVTQIESFANEFSGEDDYLIESGIIVRLLVVFATHQCRFDSIGRISKEKLENAFEKTKKGLRYAINFIKNNAAMGTLDHLSSPFLIVPIAVYSVLEDERLSTEQERDLMKWFYPYADYIGERKG